MKDKQTPGPVGQSCLTCRRRRKKCDKRRPICERCSKGGFDCLGYDCEDAPSTRLNLRDLPSEPIRATESEVLQQPYSPPTPQASRLYESLPMPGSSLPDRGALTPPYAKPKDFPVQSSFGYGLVDLSTMPHLDNRHISPRYIHEDNSAHAVPSEPRSETLPQNTYRSTTSSSGHAVLPSSVSPTTSWKSSFWFPTSVQNNQYAYPLPRSLSEIPSNVLGVIKFVLTQYDKMFAISYFKPPHQEIQFVRASVTQRLLRPFDNSRWVLVLGAKIIDAFLDGTLDRKSESFVRWIKLLEQSMHSASDQEPASEATYRLSSSLQMSFYKLRVSDTLRPCELLRSMVPTFLQLAFSDSTLWPNHHNSTAVSVAHVLASDRYELGHFIYLDSMCSMVYGMPQVLEYDTSTPPLNRAMRPIQGCPILPAQLHIALIDMNNLCGQIYIGDDWRSIEQRILSWEAPTRDTTDVESWRVITQLAIEESWRHTLLIYLYMAVCCVSSDDVRVQSSVRQIFRLIESLKGQASSCVHQYFFAQYVVAGACTPLENHRAITRERLADTKQNGLCLLRGSDLVVVLDHLWHGAAANGRAIRWSDYLMSRQATTFI
ncbi:hypothetical protein BDV93DRAFT_521081, partial [Ceratobasidium sp. AG-I]